MKVGQVLHGRYTLTALLGQGAMGMVYRATDATTGQDVAVKVIPPNLVFEPEVLERFQREGEALRQLRHPNIVGFVEMFQDDDQRAIVMEYVPGGNLHALLKQGPVPLERARRIALGLCDALTHAHDLNVIHRDLKPENVLLAEDGAPKLTDFGVARLTEKTRLTGSGTQVGTPFYMAPEAWEGKPLDAQADIWSLGVVLYEMLAGEVPFGGETLVAVMNRVLLAALPDLQALRPEVSRPLTQVIGRMLARDKAQRYATMRQVAADLERGTATAPGATLPASAASHPRRRAPAWALAMAVVLVVGLAVGAVALGAKVTAGKPTMTLMAIVPASATATGGTATSTPPPLQPTPTTAALTPTARMAPATDTATPTEPTATSAPSPTLPASATVSPTPIALTPTARVAPATMTSATGATRTSVPPTSTNVSLSGDSTGLWTQQNGLLVAHLIGTRDTDCHSIQEAQYVHHVLDKPWFFEADLRLDENEHAGALTIVSNGSRPEDWPYAWTIHCGIDSMSGATRAKADCWDQWDMGPNSIEDQYSTGPSFSDLVAWRKIRVEIDPATMTATYYVDGQNIGSHTPTRAEALKTAGFSFYLAICAQKSQSITGYVNNVRIGPVTP